MNLILENITFAYSKKLPNIFEDFSFTLQENSFNMLLGPNGTGKSTLLNLLNGAFTPSKGKVLLNDIPLKDITPLERAKNIATVFQTPIISQNITVIELVMLGRNPFRNRFTSPSKEDIQAVEEAIEIMALSSIAKKTYPALSGGEKQRVMIAQNLARKSNFLLLDEPTSAADPGFRGFIMEKLKTLTWKPAILIVTHDIMAAKTFGDNVILLKDGKIISQGNAKDIINKPNITQLYGEYASWLVN
jgi:iron complex transport system ATP-binding protein